MLEKEVVRIIARYIIAAFFCGALLAVIIVGLVFQATLYKSDQVDGTVNTEQVCQLVESEEPVGYLTCSPGFTCYFLVHYHGPMEEVGEGLFLQASFTSEAVVAGGDFAPLFYGAEVELIATERNTNGLEGNTL